MPVTFIGHELPAARSTAAGTLTARERPSTCGKINNRIER
jgi:hypothetical protein